MSCSINQITQPKEGLGQTISWFIFLGCYFLSSKKTRNKKNNYFLLVRTWSEKA